MLKLAGNYVLIAALIVLGSCLKRPDKRAPRLESKGNPGGVLPVINGCEGKEASARGGEINSRCGVQATPAPTPTKRTNTNTDKDTDNVKESEPIEDNRLLRTINVTANCYDGSRGCLYSKDDNSIYLLGCEIKSGGCKDGFLVTAKTVNADGAPRVERSSMCRDGDKTVADLSEEKIKLACKTDQDVTIELLPKTQELALSKSHLNDRHLCVITDAGANTVADFGNATLSIREGKCATSDDRIHFSMQLDFDWE